MTPSSGLRPPVRGKWCQSTTFHARPLVVLVALVTAGCSQVAAVAPVGGTREALVRFAGNDVLVAQGVSILAAPVCTADAGAVTCAGTATDGTAITVSAPADGPMTVRVGDRVLYDGPVQTVIDEAGRPS
ncbi:hypothetical protein [Pseudonocardia sp. WMMC193]|uniref:hypothetical protein n=1 Tax=Pseudonocardia sp. WMMC193 TaxID=2911965 RepID=UPI001F220838|nr:hypothetical protein [Pseudonocardia sp. WMMC193]MCF7552392.1 hypothetical protein [Pseudonocardia sp. WMMC193]